ncbi:TIGR03943 family protein [Bacillus infantis]|uniref:TIGR03943 family putative permease subunit n=1 Tax=Bacillus infantis TaxID=324767 RepID=UPI001CD62E10|nr:TIGR03943 family protein [Bacillus infantis]MCA1038485.1 TIGR03943 family protein [Bacillus infantis]
MVIHYQQGLRALILLIFSALIFKLHYTGEISKYINPKYESLSQIASVIFLVLFFIQITRIWGQKEKKHHHHHDGEMECCQHDDGDHDCGHHHDHGTSPFTAKKLLSYSIIIFPLITGFLLPPKVLDASIADKKGGMAILSHGKQKADQNKAATEENQTDQKEAAKDQLEAKQGDTIDENEPDPNLENQPVMTNDEYTAYKKRLAKSNSILLNDDVYAAYYESMHEDLDSFVGKEIELKGFVYKEEGFNEDQLVISRFLVSHCVADASIVGFLSQFQEASGLEADSWIKAKGTIEMAEYNGTMLPLLKVTEWESISEPDQPYIYPITIKVL